MLEQFLNSLKRAHQEAANENNILVNDEFNFAILSESVYEEKKNVKWFFAFLKK